MSDKAAKAPSSTAKERAGFECAAEVSALLNCVTGSSYNELKCVPLLKKLRACVEKKRVVDFQLVPPEEGCPPCLGLNPAAAPNVKVCDKPLI